MPQPRCLRAAEHSCCVAPYTNLALPKSAAPSLRPLQLAACALPRRPSHHSRKPPRRQIAIDDGRHLAPRGFLPWRLSDAGPRAADALWWAGIRNSRYHPSALSAQTSVWNPDRSCPPEKAATSVVNGDCQTCACTGTPLRVILPDGMAITFVAPGLTASRVMALRSGSLKSAISFGGSDCQTCTSAASVAATRKSPSGLRAATFAVPAKEKL